MFKLLYTEIMTRLLREVPEIKYIDQDLGQLDYYNGSRPPVGFPAVLIDFSEATFEELGVNNVQLATVTVNIRLAFTPYTSANNLQIGSFAEDALEFYELENKIHKALQGHNLTDDFRELYRMNAVTEKRDDAMRVRNIAYGVGFEDDSTIELDTKMQASLAVFNKFVDKL